MFVAMVYQVEKVFQYVSSCWLFVLPLGGAATEIQKMCLAEAAFQAKETSCGRLLSNGPSL